LLQTILFSNKNQHTKEIKLKLPGRNVYHNQIKRSAWVLDFSGGVKNSKFLVRSVSFESIGGKN
jgi:hypothetical protein